MDINIIIVFIILAITVGLLVIDIIRIDVVAISCMLALGWTGVLTPQEMFSGFSGNAVIAMISVMILGRGIARAGIMERFSKFVIKKAGKEKRKLIVYFSFSTGILSGLIQNIGAAALFLPGVMQVSRLTKIPASSLIMPIGFAAILGGTLTMVGAGSLIIVNDLLKNEGLEAYNLFSVTIIGLILLSAGILYFVLFGNSVLPNKAEGKIVKTQQEKLVEKLNLPHNIKLLTVSSDSNLIGKSPEDAGLWTVYKINLLGIGKGVDKVYAPWRGTKFEERQTLAILGENDNIEKFSEHYKLKDISSSRYFTDDFNPDISGFAEVVIPPGSDLVGQSIRKYSLRKRYAVEPIMLFHKGEKIEGDFSDVEISPGDTFIVYGKWEKIIDVNSSTDFVVLTHIDAEIKDKSKSVPALSCFFLAIILAVFGFPISMAFLTGALCMVFSGVLKINEAYQAVQWKVVFMLAGLIPLGVAMQKTRAALFLSETIMHGVIDWHPIFIIIIIAVLSTVFSLFMTNVGSIVVLAPLVMGMAEIAGLDPRTLVLLAAICAANSFILPTHQVNAFLMSSGGYKNIDYIKAGSGLTIIFLVIVISAFYFFII